MHSPIVQCHSENAKVSFTGHSLGAILAELTAAKYRSPAVTFDSPGSEDLMNEFTTDDKEYANEHIIMYNAAPNLVNTLAEHMGVVYRVYPYYETPDKVVLYQQGGQPSYDFYALKYTSQS